MGLGETKRCVKKREEAGGALRYALISAFEVTELAREAR